mmetsp:Transcript_37193/g.54397  ORF Transcript_37193/g.54397 Transcript_37193/m.54397 type:complete len:287 (+) Transcript_37193:75-935(+)
MPSLRFQTTTQEGLEKTITLQSTVSRCTATAKDLEALKKANSKTSIAFGTHSIDYETVSAVSQKSIFDADNADFREENEKQKKMKAGLTKVNFRIGNGENVDYSLISSLPEPTRELHEYTGILSPEVKNSIKKSSVYFGDNLPAYETTSQSFMKLTNCSDEFNRLRSQTDHLKREHRKQNFTFGTDHEPNWSSDYQRGYKTYTKEERINGKGQLSPKMLNNLRKSNLALTQMFSDENTCMASQSATVHNMDSLKGRDRKLEEEQTLKMKKELKKINFVLGCDPDYM